MSTTQKVILGIITLTVLAVAYYGISPLFRNKALDEAVPENVLQGARGTAEDTALPAPAEEEVTDSAAGPFSAPVVGTFGHPAEGTARIIDTTEGIIVRYENFSTINGPDLHVYLSTDLEATNYVDLGPIKGTSGNINYPVPEGTDVSRYRYVMHWCVPFRVVFNYAEIR